ncbi:MAG TPA: hypothetical protein VNO14_04965, partial [Blastocatellia bacterium]|nr:hypothetical protein [Blastocatellia bacterium]
MKRFQVFTIALALILLTILPVTQVSAVRPARPAYVYAPGEVIIKLKAGLADASPAYSRDRLMSVARSAGEASSGPALLSIEPIAGRL